MKFYEEIKARRQRHRSTTIDSNRQGTSRRAAEVASPWFNVKIDSVGSAAREKDVASSRPSTILSSRRRGFQGNGTQQENMERTRKSIKTTFEDLPDLVLLKILKFLTKFDGLRAFYDLKEENDRLVDLLIEARCFSSVETFPFGCFKYFCREIVPKVGSKLINLTLNNDQLVFVMQNKVFRCLSNVRSLKLMNLFRFDEIDAEFKKFLGQIEDLKMEFLGENEISTQSTFFEHFLFGPNSNKVELCSLTNRHGLVFSRLNLFPNASIRVVELDLKTIDDLRSMFDLLPSLKTVKVRLKSPSDDQIDRVQSLFGEKIRGVEQFSLVSRFALNFDATMKIVRSMTNLRALTLVEENYQEFGVDLDQLDELLGELNDLTEFRCFLKIFYFRLKKKSLIEENSRLKKRFNVEVRHETSRKTILAFTKPWLEESSTIDGDFFVSQKEKLFSELRCVDFSIDKSEQTLPSLIRRFQLDFPSAKEIRLIGNEKIKDEKPEFTTRIERISCLDATKLRSVEVFLSLLDVLVNLTELRLNDDLLCRTDFSSLLEQGTRIRSVEIFSSRFDKIENLLRHWQRVEFVTINTKLSSTSGKRVSFDVFRRWFERFENLFRIRIETRRLDEILLSTRFENDPKIFCQTSSEILTVYR